MKKTSEELAKADAQASAFHEQVRELQAELDKIDATADNAAGRRACLESQIRILKIAATRLYAPVLDALEEELKNAPSSPVTDEPIGS